MQHQILAKNRPSLPNVHSQSLQNRKPWPSLEHGLLQPVQTQAALKHYVLEEMVASNAEQQADLMKAASTQQIPLTSDYR